MQALGVSTAVLTRLGDAVAFFHAGLFGGGGRGPGDGEGAGEGGGEGSGYGGRGAIGLPVEELQSRFDLEHVQKGGAVFDRVRLEWINGQWIRRLDNEELLQRLRPFYDAAAADGRIARAATDEELAKLLPIIRERIQLLSAAIPLTDFLFAGALAHDPTLDRPVALKLLWRGSDVESEASTRLLREAQAMAKLRHGNVALCESRAICHYIERTFGGPALIPEDAFGAAQTEQWISIVNTAMVGRLEQTQVQLDLERWRLLAAEVLTDLGVRGAAELSLLFVEPEEIAEPMYSGWLVPWMR